MAGLSVTARVSPQWRDALGRFARPPVDDAFAAGLLALGTQTVERLKGATPVRTGRMRAGWTSTYVPSEKKVVVSDEAPYAFFVIFGTRRMRPNPDLHRVMADLPEDGRVALRGIGQDVLKRLMGR